MLLRGVFGVVRRAGFSSNRLDVAAERPTLPPRATLNSTPLSSASRQDVVFLRGIQVFGRHGASKAERERGEKFSIDVALTTDVFWAGRADDMNNLPVRYDWVYSWVESCCADNSFLSIEKLAETISQCCLQNCPQASSIEVTVRKPQVNIPGTLAEAGVTIRRTQEDYQDQLTAAESKQ